MAKEIRTAIHIQESAQKIWEVLCDFSAYPQWNPFIKSLKGEVKVGNSIEVDLPGMKFKPKVLVYTENHEFVWLGHLFLKGLFDGRHSFKIIEQADSTCVFEHSEKFNGILVPLFSKMLDTKTKVGFEQMNRALKQRVETNYV
jgi:hypothetical protein